MKFGVSQSSFQYEENCRNSHLYSKNKIGNYHKKNWKKDLTFLKKLGVQNYRFSIEWSEIEPKEGIFCQEKINWYHNYIDAIKKKNIEPILCLFHFSLPKWFHKKGGFLKHPEDFERFALKMISEYQSKIKYFMIYNEPNVYCICSYFLGRWKPNHKNILEFSTCLKNMIRVYNSIIKVSPRKLSFGVSINIIPGFHSTFLNDYFDFLWNDSFLKDMSKDTKFIGINYYFSKNKTWSDILTSETDHFRNNKSPSDLGWPVTPSNIHDAVSIVQTFFPSIEIWITENGISTKNEKNKIEFITSHINEAISNPSITKYFYWTLIDCYEWDYPNTEFGLISRNREPKKSFFSYQKLISQYST